MKSTSHQTVQKWSLTVIASLNLRAVRVRVRVAGLSGHACGKVEYVYAHPRTCVSSVYAWDSSMGMEINGFFTITFKKVSPILTHIPTLNVLLILLLL